MTNEYKDDDIVQAKKGLREEFKEPQFAIATLQEDLGVAAWITRAVWFHGESEPGEVKVPDPNAPSNWTVRAVLDRYIDESSS